MSNEIDNNPKKKLIKILAIVIGVLAAVALGMRWFDSLPTNFNSKQAQSAIHGNQTAQKPNKLYLTSDQAKFIKPMKYANRR